MKAVGDTLDRAKTAEDAGRTAISAQRSDFLSGLVPGARRCGRDLPGHFEDRAWRLSFFGMRSKLIWEFDPLTGEKTATLDHITVYPNSHYVTPRPTLHAGDPEI